jgi:hypothetical protein
MFSFLKAPIGGESRCKLLVMGKQNMSGLPVRLRFEKARNWREKACIPALYLAYSRDTLSSILFCSIPGGRESESTNSFQ